MTIMPDRVDTDPVVNLDEWPQKNGARDLNWLLTAAGPTFSDNPDNPNPDNTEVFARIELFGQFVHQVESFAQQEAGRQIWLGWLNKNATGIPEPGRVLQRAIDAGRTRTDDTPIRWLTRAELATITPPAPLIGDILAEQSFTVMHGPYESGKTFMALDMALSVATGRSWHGVEVTQGPVAFILAEGQGGIDARVDAWSDTHGIAPNAPFYILPQPVDFRDPARVTALLASLDPWDAPPKLLIIDTLFRCFGGGNEHSPEDMGAFIAGVDRFRLTTGGAALINHHPGYAKEDRSRGHSSLEQAADTVIKLDRNKESGLIVMSCEKQKDGPHFEKRRFYLTPRAGSLVVESAAGSGRLSPTDLSTIATLYEIGLYDGASYTVWKDATKMAKTTFARTIKGLLSTAHIEKREEKYFVTQLGKDAMGLAS